MKFGASQTGVGKPVERVEDARLLTGQGRYTDDIALPGMAHGVTLRSPYGHAEIRGIETAAALEMPGVLAIYVHADVAHYGEIPCELSLSAPVSTPRRLLAAERVRFVGDGVAFVVAESREQARAAAEMIEVDYDELPAVGSLAAALAPGAPRVWPEAASNDLFLWQVGDAAAADAAIARATHVTRLEGVVQNRVAPTSMEVRAAVGEWAQGVGYTLHFGSQGVAGARRTLANDVLKCPVEELRVITGDVGGGFGMKGFLYPEYGLVLHAARALGRPVKWTGDRSDAFQTDTHGRAMTSNASLALDADGRILALKVESWSDLGAYQSQFGPGVQTFAGGRIMGGVYRIPAIHNAVHGVVSNTAPVDAYRGAGRPESAYLMERMMDEAARDLGLAPDEIRRRNLLKPAELPHRNGLGLNFDVGDFPAVLEKALANADWAGFPARRADAERRGRRYGRGLCYYVEIAGGGSPAEFADVRVLPGGLVEVAVGTQSNGQGHETAYAQVTAERLGIPLEQVRIVQGDTGRLDEGNGTGGSRSMAAGGAACLLAADELVARGIERASADLGDEVDYADGLFRARASNTTLSLAELAAKHPQALDGRAHYAPGVPRPTFPNGCHVAEVEIDPATGGVTVARYSLVDDFGTIVNPMLLLGQIHGGVAQGLGQALIEHVVYDEAAQLLTGSFMDYGIPRAADMPRHIGFDTLPTISPVNPLGAKGCGEAGTIGAMPSLMNAIIHALDGTRLEMPATPEKIWRAARALEKGIAAG